MEVLKNTYLFRLYKADKIVFVLVALFIGGTLYSVLNCYTYIFSKRCEEFPFLLYGMYSLREEPQKTYTAYSFFIGGKEVNYSRLKDSQREMLSSPVRHIVPLMGSTLESGEKLDQLKEWLFRYSVDMRGLETNKMEAYKLTCAYTDNGLPEVINKELLFAYELQ